MLENTEGTIQKWTLQRNWQHRSHKTKKNKTKTQDNMYRTPLHATKHGWYEHDNIISHRTPLHATKHGWYEHDNILRHLA